jgi:hypothetical protein
MDQRPVHLVTEGSVYDLAFSGTVGRTAEKLSSPMFLIASPIPLVLNRWEKLRRRPDEVHLGFSHPLRSPVFSTPMW